MLIYLPGQHDLFDFSLENRDYYVCVDQNESNWKFEKLSDLQLVEDFIELNEIWCTAQHVECDFLMVSSNGRVYQIGLGSGNGKLSYGHLKQLHINHNGYQYINYTSNVTRKCKSVFVHRLVIWAFTSCDLSSDYETHHIDDNKSNNCIWNLMWVPHKTNMNFFFSSEESQSTRQQQLEKNKEYWSDPLHREQQSARMQKILQSDKIKQKLQIRNATEETHNNRVEARYRSESQRKQTWLENRQNAANIKSL